VTLVARVVPDVTGLDRHFDYIAPDSLHVTIGALVRVPLAGRRIGGWVVGLSPLESEAEVAVDRLLPIAKVTGIGPGEDTIELAEWAVPRWAGRLRAFLVAASPPSAIVSLPPASHGPPVPEPVHPGAQRLLAGGGGILRHPPAADVVPVVLAACRLGPALVVVPSVAQARLLASRLRRAGRTVALMPQDWGSAAAGVDVVIGARRAAWAPCAGLAVVVVLDEHDEALQEERQPTWHARDVAIERAHRAGVPVLLVSPCPSVTAVASFGADRLMKPSVIDERNGWPIVDIVDRSRDDPWQKSLLTSPLIRQLRAAERRVVCVLNTTGRARLLACRQCRSIQRCEVCEAAVGQREDGHFECSRCGTVRPPVCQVCGSAGFAALKVGVSRLREELEKAAGRDVVKVVGADDDLEPLPDAGIYVGTEAVLHRVRHADTVAFLDFDSELLAPRYRAAEQAMTLLARAARLVGGRATGGRILVQTFIPRHEVLDAALHADPGRLVQKELERRRALRFPPAAAIALVTGAGAAEFAAAAERNGVQSSATTDGKVLLRADTWPALGDAIAVTPRPRASRLRIVVDPPRL
jgi:primosomal protein N' (replication factor Y) (superfamily II helicase)